MKHLVLLGVLAGLCFAGSSANAGEDGGLGKHKNHEARWERKFDRIDANDDGQISKEEFLAFKAAHPHHHHKKKGEGQGQKNDQ